jgi:hypothetical protein
MQTLGLSPQAVASQLKIFESGVSVLRLDRPCRPGDGILSVSEEEARQLVALHDRAAGEGRFTKFVPASGAASRMFRDWYGILEEGPDWAVEARDRFLASLERYPFFRELEASPAGRDGRLKRWLAEKNHHTILSFILDEQGLNLGNLPKALLAFHGYPEGSRTAVEEQLAEGALYVRDAQKRCRLHFTVSQEHRESVSSFLARATAPAERRWDVSFDIGLSLQDPSSSTIAVDPENRPFRDEKGALVFRPAGHGALLSNLHALGGDLVFIKNIDNVVPDRLKPAMVHYKKVLGGLLVQIQASIYRYLGELEDRGITQDVLDEIRQFCRERFHVVFHEGFRKMPAWYQAQGLHLLLHRPLRVCGMVRNQGEPGGGPFWVAEADGTTSLQIVEEIQIDTASSQQRQIWQSAAYFNPVDLVAGVRDHHGEPFDLQRFVDDKAWTIAKKSEKGRELKALEMPGLWNGAMARWNTVFVEVPVETFNPVKVLEDLLRPQHRVAEP